VSQLDLPGVLCALYIGIGSFVNLHWHLAFAVSYSTVHARMSVLYCGAY
jgi:hypothetical protein